MHKVGFRYTNANLYLHKSYVVMGRSGPQNGNAEPNRAPHAALCPLGLMAVNLRYMTTWSLTGGCESPNDDPSKIVEKPNVFSDNFEPRQMV